MHTTSLTRIRAFTLVELMVVMALAALVGGIAYLILNTGLLMFAQNTATNVAHQQARMAMLQMQKEMHQAVSPTQLVNANGNPVNGNGPAAGVRFHVFAAGPFRVTAQAKDNQKFISVDLGNFQATATDRLVIENHDLEIDIARTPAGTGMQTLELTENIPYTVNITEKDDQNRDVAKPVYAIITSRVAYRIENEELVYYDQNGNRAVLAREITSDKPFTRGKKGGGGGGADSKFMATIQLSSGKGKGPKKNRFKASSMILDAEVPARAILCSKP